MALDIACGMEVDPDDPAAIAEYDGQTYYFCSEGCKEQFESDPETYRARELPFLGEIEGLQTPRLPYGGVKGEFELSMADREQLSVGDEVTLTRSLGDDELQQFAQITSDTNALHLNDEFAERTRFGRRIIHGTLVSGLISAALAAFPGMTIYLSQQLEFVAPADIGDTFTARCRIADTLADDRYRLATHVENQDDEIIIQGTATVLIDDLPHRN